MACDEVFAVIASLPSRKELVVNSPRTVAVKECVKEVVAACAKEPGRIDSGLVAFLWTLYPCLDLR